MSWSSGLLPMCFSRHKALLIWEHRATYGMLKRIFSWPLQGRCWRQPLSPPSRALLKSDNAYLVFPGIVDQRDAGQDKGERIELKSCSPVLVSNDLVPRQNFFCMRPGNKCICDG